MVVDTSAVLAILMVEPEERLFANILHRSPISRLSAASYLECAMVIDGKGGMVRRAMLDTFLEEFEITVEPVTFAQAKLARQALDFFGKGRHPAALNFGDCFAYALAKSLREPILFKGTDFSRTDLIAAN
ncbi:MAG: type II toxin-antitoxin system VapC family toxin [Bryobacter sp.]|nr:type II toxin-antitoxin system VapC family toxin [Bryobacter sp.]